MDKKNIVHRMKNKTVAQRVWDITRDKLHRVKLKPGESYVAALDKAVDLLLRHRR